MTHRPINDRWQMTNEELQTYFRFQISDLRSQISDFRFQISDNDKWEIMENDKWKMNRLFASLPISTSRRYGILPTRRGDPVDRSCDTSFESWMSASPNNRRATPCDRRTTARNIPCKAPPRIRDKRQTACSSTPTCCRSSDGNR